MDSRCLLLLTLISAMAQARPYTQPDLDRRGAHPYRHTSHQLPRYSGDRFPREVPPASEYPRFPQREDNDCDGSDRACSGCSSVLVLYRDPQLPRAEYYRSGEIIVPGYLYNRGTGRYLKAPRHSAANAVLVDARDDAPSAVAFVGSAAPNQVIYSLVVLPDSDASADHYQLYQTNRQRPYHRLFATTDHNGVQLSFHAPQGRDLLDGEFLPTLPYYDNDRAVKVVHKTQCLDVKDGRHLVLRSCIDDDGGRPTLDNDKQLFVWCPVQQPHLCEQDYPQQTCAWR